MRRHDFLQRVHTQLAPRSYLEIGVFDGRSLALSRVPTVAVDPVARAWEGVTCDLKFVEATSDDFFAGPDPLGHLPGRKVDLAFIDGMHLFEFALRDFINVEKRSHPGTVIVLDDMLPRKHVEALRQRRTKAWTGDVYKMIPVLARYRPDLLCLPVDTAPTGVLMVFGADASSKVLSEAYDEIVAEWLTDDPQKVPPEILGRTIAVDPRDLLGADFWPRLVRGRRRVLPRRQASDRLVQDVRRSLAGEEPPPPWAGRLRRAVKPRTRLRRIQRQIRRRLAAHSGTKA